MGVTWRYHGQTFEISVESEIQDLTKSAFKAGFDAAGVRKPKVVIAPDTHMPAQREPSDQLRKAVNEMMNQIMVPTFLDIDDVLVGHMHTPLKERPKCSGKYKKGERVRIMQDSPNGAPLSKHTKVTVVSHSLEGYEVMDRHGETWWVYEQHIHKKRKK